LIAAEEAARRINDLAAAKSALGLYYDNATSAFVVVLPAAGAGSAATAADFRAAGVNTRVAKSALTKEKVDAVTKTVELRAWHPEAKKYSYGFHFDPRKGVVSVGTDAPPAVIAPLLEANSGLIEYRHEVTQRDTRRNDGPPHWGGASITGGGATCSSGFTVRNGAGTNFMVTAGHCFPQGTSVSSPEGGHAWGTVVDRAPFPLWDLELLGGNSYFGFIYRGDLNGFGQRVVGSGDPVIGFTGYCRSGQTTAEQCGSTVNSLTAEFCDASGCTPSLIEYTGGGTSAGGDSGAPYYVPSVDNNSVHARGIHIARSGTTMYAERWNTVASRFGVSIATG
jgi:hypothetical protein